MNRKLWLFVLCAVLAIATDSLRSVLQRKLIERNLTQITDGVALLAWFPSAEIGTLWLYLILFGVLGFVVVSLVAPAPRAVLWAVLTGLAIPVFDLFFEAPRPWTMLSHGNTWITAALGWVGLYMPPLASGLGGLLANLFMLRLRSNLREVQTLQSRR